MDILSCSYLPFNVHQVNLVYNADVKHDIKKICGGSSLQVLAFHKGSVSGFVTGEVSVMIRHLQGGGG